MAKPTLGARMRAARATLGLSQRDVAKKMGLHDASPVSRWEMDKTNPSKKNFGLLMTHLLAPAEARVTKAQPLARTTVISNTPLTKEVAGAPKPETAKESGRRSGILLLSFMQYLRNPDLLDRTLNFLKLAQSSGLTIDDLVLVLGEAKQG